MNVAAIGRASLLMLTGLMTCARTPDARAQPSGPAKASNDAGAQPITPGEETDYLPEEPILPRRRFELVAAAFTRFTAVPNTNDDWELHDRTGMGVELVPWISYDTQWLRSSVYFMMSYGRWGDQNHGGFIAEPGINVRLGTSDVVHLYGLLGGGLQLGTRDGGHVGVNPHFGTGLRVLNAIFAELAFEIDIPFDKPFFEGSAHERSLAWGAGLEVGFDFCGLSAFCEHRAPEPVKESHTCALYQRARGLCGIDRKAHVALCHAADEALDPGEPSTHDENPVATFLRTVETAIRQLPAGAIDESARSDLAERLSALRAAHANETAWLAQGHAAALNAAKAERTLAWRRIYAPYPTELALLFGCGCNQPSCDVCSSMSKDEPLCVANP